MITVKTGNKKSVSVYRIDGGWVRITTTFVESPFNFWQLVGWQPLKDAQQQTIPETQLLPFPPKTDPPQPDSRGPGAARGQERPAPTPLLTRDPEPGPLRPHLLIFIYLFLVALGLRHCVWAFSTCSERGRLLTVEHKLLIVVASLAVEHGL